MKTVLSIFTAFAVVGATIAFGADERARDDRAFRADDRPPKDRPQERQNRGRDDRPRDGAKRYNIEQAISDRAQLNTIAFSALAFVTGSFGSDTFFPPGKLADYFGFQYMRDIDAGSSGHNSSFLTKIADNMLFILNDAQKAKLIALAHEQEGDIRKFAQKRLPLIWAFRQNMSQKIPQGSKGLDRQAVIAYTTALYELDGSIAYKRAKVMAEVVNSFDAKQKAALAKLKFGDSSTWRNLTEQLDKRSLSHEAHVAVMTYASEMFAWQAGNVEADTYFCPERHGTYFGAFGLKSAPAMGAKNYTISSSLTGDSGEAFLATISDSMQKKMNDLTTLQKKDLEEIVSVRRAISTELRRFLRGENADRAKVLALSKRYGELDGKLSYLYASTFADIAKSLTPDQKDKLNKIRQIAPKEDGAYLYSDPIPTPKITGTEFLFGVRR